MIPMASMMEPRKREENVLRGLERQRYIEIYVPTVEVLLCVNVSGMEGFLPPSPGR